LKNQQLSFQKQIIMPKKEPNKENKLKTVQFTMQEIWAASRHTVQKNKKKYNRKDFNKDPFYSLCK
jgi:hypothetical protein